MTPRERNMAIGILALILLGGGAFGGYTFVYSPLQDANAAIQQLNDEIKGTAEKPEGLEDRVIAMKKAAVLAVVAKRQSLPKEPDTAKTQYKLLLERLLKQAKIKDYTMGNASTLESRAPATPELAPKKPAYTRLAFGLIINKTDIWHLADFLREFYQLDLLHQITELKITRVNKTTEMRNGLSVHITIEAIILEGAESRSSLFPVLLAGRITPSGEAIAAIGGGLAVERVATYPELVRRVTALTSTPVLATHTRDYSLLALHDIFYGILPPNKTYTGITIAKIDDIKIDRGEKIPPVKIHMTGDEADGAILSATATGYLIPEGPLSIDPDTNTISFPAPLESAPSYAGATIYVVAISETGRQQKISFKLSYNISPIVKDDIASAIKLIMISSSSEGNMSAFIQDSATPSNYKITVSPKKGIEVVKFEQTRMKPLWRPDPRRPDWKPDFDYDHPSGVLAISDSSSSTKRTFKVIRIEDKALIVADIGKPEAKPEPKGRGGFQPGGRGPGGGGGAPKSSPSDPRSFLAVTLATTILPRAAPQPLVLYRWPIGMSLKDLDKGKIPSSEAKTILNSIAQNGTVESPVSSTKP